VNRHFLLSIGGAACCSLMTSSALPAPPSSVPWPPWASWIALGAAFCGFLLWLLAVSLLPAYGLFGLCRAVLPCGLNAQGVLNVLSLVSRQGSIFDMIPFGMIFVAACVALNRASSRAAAPSPSVKRTPDAATGVKR
jgi:hypothetical protein